MRKDGFYINLESKLKHEGECGLADGQSGENAKGF